ncbi:50S ribosomal protein L11 [Candidatus Pacearchaeota archaeon]|nr:50S ribosomal protein L11 [Candidatus Pacearchaeota archaeon]
MIIKLMVDGGEMKPGPTVAQKIGPLGINMGKVISEVNQATQEFKGIKVPVSLDVDPKAKTFKVEVSSPPTSELLKKELGAEKGSGDHKKNKIGNISIETAIKVAKTKHSGMLAKDFKSAVKSVVGSCVSLGILVENKLGTELERDIEKGLFDSEIKAQKTDTSADKKAKLEAYYQEVIKNQEALKKAEEAAKAAEEAAKAAATPAATTGAAAAATPGAAATPAKPGEVKKEEPKAAKGKEAAKK